MPKGHRSSRSQQYYHDGPTSTPTSSAYPPLSARPSTMQQQYYAQPIPVSMPHQQSYQHYSTGGPVQPLSYSMPVAPPVSIPSLRPSSGAWSPQDDQTLMAARAQGMNWAPLQQTYFPTKSSNACRKRHERLMERKNSDDWDGRKLEKLAKEYMGMRREIWQGLAQATGEKWMVVEQKCMQQGFKNLQTAARSCQRRERMLDTSPSGLSSGNYGDESGISDDFDQEYEADGASEHSGGSNNFGGGSYYQGHHSHDSAGSNESRVSGYGQQSRLPSMDMGAILNRDINGRHDGSRR